MDFITDLFSQMGTRDSLLVLLFLFIAFLIGLISGWLYWRKRLEELRTELTHTQTANIDLGQQVEEWRRKWEVTEAELKVGMQQLDTCRSQFRTCEIEKGQLRAELYEASEKLAGATDNAPSDTGELATVKAAIASALGVRVKAATSEERDDLKRISGVGPFIEKKLNALGIYTFEQISQLDDELVAKVNAAIEFFPGRIARDNWVGQAQELHRHKGGGGV
jgi:predicted flap endonuclease-1-like 5' DNA nuclease